MLVIYCLGWWYGRGWKWRIAKASQNMSYWAEYFSLGKLLPTLFSPYRQTLVDGRGMQAVLDSLVSRLVGFVVRFFVILTAAIVMLFYSILTLVIVLLWPLMPLVPLAAIVVVATGVAI
ncbi:MAG TPA: hypothetical protein VLH84_02705 [Patescibacteria group bacterium]|nr:hypothetical protein [Patescibacteria group bacterium]